MTSFILVILLYSGNGPFLKTIEGFSSQESCIKAAQDFNGFAQNKDTGAMAFCIEKNDPSNYFNCRVGIDCFVPMDHIVGHHEIRIPKDNRMTCRSTHFSCECQRELLEDAVDSLAKVLAGLERYREGLALYDRGRLTKSVQGIPGALSVLRRARLQQG